MARSLSASRLRPSRTPQVGSTAHVRVPARTANLGPGFDSIGMALDVWDDARAEVTDGGLVVDARGSGANTDAAAIRLSALGWSAAGAYYLEFSRLNGATLSLMSGVPRVERPSYLGLGPALSADVAPLSAAAEAFMEARVAAIAAGEIVPWFEPQVALADNRLIARRLAPNPRELVATRAYLDQAGSPRTLVGTTKANSSSRMRSDQAW